MSVASGIDHKGELFAALQRLLPQHTLSRLLGRIAASENPKLKDFLIRKAIERYNIDLSEAVSDNLADYPSFNHFFTRHLRAGTRPIEQGEDSLISPADGAISQLGSIEQGRLFQAKGHSFSAQSLLGLSREQTDRFANGSFVTVYLSPRDYHRVHMPYPGNLIESLYIPGRLFSVNNSTANNVTGLFARNERLVCLFETDRGLMAVVLVGAIFVAGIATVWQEHYVAGQMHHERFGTARHFDRGEELGLFRFGSTAIVAMENTVDFSRAFAHGVGVRMGEKLGVLAPRNNFQQPVGLRRS